LKEAFTYNSREIKQSSWLEKETIYESERECNEGEQQEGWVGVDLDIDSMMACHGDRKYLAKREDSGGGGDDMLQW